MSAHTFSKACPLGGAFCDCAQPGAQDDGAGGIKTVKKESEGPKFKPIKNDAEAIDHSDKTPEEEEAYEAKMDALVERTAEERGDKKMTTKKNTVKKEKKEKPAKAKTKEKKPAKVKKALAKKGDTSPSGTYKRKGEKDGSKSNRGPKGLSESKRQRDATDGGVWGRKLAAARKKKEWSQKELAKRVEMTQPAICNIEKGTVNASEEAKKKLSKAVGM